jgi:hypothetical protein
MAIAVAEVQQGKAGSAVTSQVTGTFATPPSVGDLVVVFYCCEAGGTITTTAATDSAGHTATALGSMQIASGLTLAAWVFENLTTGTGLSSYKVTGNWSSSTGTVIALHITGNLTPTSYNGDIVQNSTTTPTSGTNPSIGPTTVAPAANSLFIGALVSNSAADAAYADGTNIAWTHVTNEIQTNNTADDALWVEHFINTGGSVTKQTAKWTGASNTWFGLIASFAPSVGGVAFIPGAPLIVKQAVNRATNW